MFDSKQEYSIIKHYTGRMVVTFYSWDGNLGLPQSNVSLLPAF